MNKATLAQFEHLLSIISTDFDRRVLEDLDFATDMPSGAYVLFQLEIDGLAGGVAKEINSIVAGFNAWLKKLAESQRDPQQPVYQATLVVRYKPVLPPQNWRFLDRFPRDFKTAPLFPGV